VERLVPAYRKTNVPGLQSFLRGKIEAWASNGSCMEETGNVLRKESSRVSIDLSHTKF
jgi:hypothetical protein